MVKEKHKRTDDPGAMSAGDGQLDVSPPNVEEAQPLAGGGPRPAAAAVGPEGTASPAADGESQGAAGPPTDGVGVGNGSAASAALEQELAALRRDLKDASERHLRLAAEFDNYRKRMERERAELWGRAQGEIASRLLDTLDDLERVAHHSETATAQTLHEGVQLIERKLRSALTTAGLEDVEAENASFDPQVMEAVAVMPAESPEDDEVVSDVFQRGYRFKGQLLRAARVRVKKHE
jgi:molecular chaperone GrpE